MVLKQNTKLEKVSSRSILFMCFHEPRVAGRLADVPLQHLPGPEAENLKCGPLQMLVPLGGLMMRPVSANWPNRVLCSKVVGASTI
jgi:hypothetical protein